MFHGTGFDFVGLRDWQAGDRFENIDWPQSSLTNFSPLIVREFEQPTTSSVIMVADRSASTRCGATGGSDTRGTQIATLIARAIATVGMSAVFFQDSIGLITFDEGFRAARRGAAAHRQGPRHSLPRRLPARRRPAGHPERRQPERDADGFFAQDRDDAGDLGLHVRRRAGVPAASCGR